MTTWDTSYISSTIIDGSANGSVVQINSGEISAGFILDLQFKMEPCLWWRYSN